MKKHNIEGRKIPEDCHTIAILHSIPHGAVLLPSKEKLASQQAKTMRKFPPVFFSFPVSMLRFDCSLAAVTRCFFRPHAQAPQDVAAPSSMHRPLRTTQGP